MYDAVALVSSDSDFTPLAVRLKESGMYVIGVGEKKTPEAFCNACDDFIYLEYLKSSEPKKEKKGEKKSSKTRKQESSVQEKEAEDLPDLDEIHTLLRIAYEKYQDDDGFINVSSAGTYIKRVKPEFNTYLYGFQKLSDLLRAFPDRYEVKRYSTNGNAGIVMYRCR